jgi:hypothetical protein
VKHLVSLPLARAIISEIDVLLVDLRTNSMAADKVSAITQELEGNVAETIKSSNNPERTLNLCMHALLSSHEVDRMAWLDILADSLYVHASSSIVDAPVHCMWDAGSSGSQCFMIFVLHTGSVLFSPSSRKTCIPLLQVGHLRSWRQTKIS